MENVVRLNGIDYTAIQDKEIMARVSSGEEEALLYLYTCYGSHVFNYLVRILNDIPAAEDVLQETFVAVWRGAGHFQGRSKIKTWIFKIAHHQAVNWLRKKKNTTSLELIEESGWHDSPETMALKRSESREIEKAVNRLSRKHRAVIELSFVQDLSYAEIAEVLACPVGTVKSRMSYALKYLSSYLDEGSMPD